MGAGCYKRDLAPRLALLLRPMCALLRVFLHHVGVQTEGPCSGLNEMSFIVSGICMLGPQLVVSSVSIHEGNMSLGVGSQLSKNLSHFEFALSASCLTS